MANKLSLNTKKIILATIAISLLALTLTSPLVLAQGFSDGDLPSVNAHGGSSGSSGIGTSGSSTSDWLDNDYTDVVVLAAFILVVVAIIVVITLRVHNKSKRPA